MEKEDEDQNMREGKKRRIQEEKVKRKAKKRED